MAEEQKKEEDSRDKDVISSDDFKKLEQAEEKNKGLLHKLFNKKEKPKEDKKGKKKGMEIDATDPKVVSTILGEQGKKIDDLTVSVEKIKGKIDMQKDVDNAQNERLGMMQEDIGSFRSTIIEKERFFDKMETEFEKMKDAIADVHPEKLEKRFNEQEKTNIKFSADLEMNKQKIIPLTEEIQGYRKQMIKIKSFENLLDMFKQIKEKSDEIEKSKRYIDRIASKAEMMMSELSKKLMLLDEHEQKIVAMEDLTKDSMENFDNIETTKKEVEKVLESLQNKERSVEDTVNVLKDKLFDKERKLFSTKITAKPAVGSKTGPQPVKKGKGILSMFKKKQPDAPPAPNKAAPAVPQSAQAKPAVQKLAGSQLAQAKPADAKPVVLSQRERLDVPTPPPKLVSQTPPLSPKHAAVHEQVKRLQEKYNDLEQSGVAKKDDLDKIKKRIDTVHKTIVNTR